jgi:flagellar hook-length control protein FliK
VPPASFTATLVKTNWSHAVSTILTTKVDDRGATTVNDRTIAVENRNDGSQNESSQKGVTETGSSGASQTDETSSDSKPFADAKPTNEAQPTAAGSAAASTNANLASDVVASEGPLVTNPLVNEHAVGPGASKDDGPLTASPQGQDPASSGPVANASPLNDTSRVTNLQMSGNVSQSEIHLAMQGDHLGSVELHAHVAGEQVGAAIVVEKRDAHAALSLELPALREALWEKNFCVEHIWLTQSTLESTAGDAGNAYGQQSRQRHGGRFGDAQEQHGFASLQAEATDAEGIFDERGRLSVLA